MTLQLIPPHDQLTSDDGAETLLLYGDHVSRLGPLGAVIVEHSRRPVSVEDLTAVLVEHFGAPPADGADITRQAVADLIAQGILERLEDAA